MHVSHLAKLLVSLISVSQVACVAVGDVFIVKGGTTNGGCDGKNIDQWFQDSLALIKSASTGATSTDDDVRKYLKTFFNIGPNDDASQASGRLSARKETARHLKLFTHNIYQILSAKLAESSAVLIHLPVASHGSFAAALGS